MAILPSILAWKIPWTEEPGGYSPCGWKRVGHDSVTKQLWTYTSTANFNSVSLSSWSSLSGLSEVLLDCKGAGSRALGSSSDSTTNELCSLVFAHFSGFQFIHWIIKVLVKGLALEQFYSLKLLAYQWSNGITIPFNTWKNLEVWERKWVWGYSGNGKAKMWMDPGLTHI